MPVAYRINAIGFGAIAGSDSKLPLESMIG
jgi:hypothetical protein